MELVKAGYLCGLTHIVKAHNQGRTLACLVEVKEEK
jgi:hypothetical protein